MGLLKKRISCKEFGKMLANIVLEQTESYMDVVDEFEALKTKK